MKTICLFTILLVFSEMVPAQKPWNIALAFETGGVNGDFGLSSDFRRNNIIKNLHLSAGTGVAFYHIGQKIGGTFNVPTRFNILYGKQDGLNAELSVVSLFEVQKSTSFLHPELVNTFFANYLMFSIGCRYESSKKLFFRTYLTFSSQKSDIPHFYENKLAYQWYYHANFIYLPVLPGLSIGYCF